MNLSVVNIPICLHRSELQICTFSALAIVAYLLSSSVTIKMGALARPAPLLVDAKTEML